MIFLIMYSVCVWYKDADAKYKYGITLVKWTFTANIFKLRKSDKIVSNASTSIQIF